MNKPWRKTKIICTIGPASESENKISALIDAGMNVARINFSHGTHSYHDKLIQRIRRIAKASNKPISVMQDLQGPRVRIGSLIDGQPIKLKAGQELVITTIPLEGTRDVVSTNYVGLSEHVHPDDKLLIDDGKIELRVTRTDDKDVTTEVLVGGKLKPHKGINFPDGTLGIHAFTKKDREDLEFGISRNVDYVAVSFVQTADDPLRVREAMRALVDQQNTSNSQRDEIETPIISKLEHPLAIDNLDEILNVSQGVMIARGDLGVELSPEKVPAAQKHIIERANELGKISITATQMIESMVSNPIPTRAEASDVANAIFDGTDAVMLSAETAIGEFPVETVQTMDAIVCEAEKHEFKWGRYNDMDPHAVSPITAVALARAARDFSSMLNVSAVIAFTRSGRSVRILSKTRPPVPIMAFTIQPNTRDRMALMLGVTPFIVPRAMTLQEMVKSAEDLLLDNNIVKIGQRVVVIAGLPIDRMPPSNTVVLHTIGDAI